MPIPWGLVECSAFYLGLFLNYGLKSGAIEFILIETCAEAAA